MSSIEPTKDATLDQSILPSSGVRGKESGQFPHGLGAWTKLENKMTRTSAAARPQQSESEYTSALRMVQKASETIDALQERCHRLERDARETHDRVKNEAESSERVIKDWERLANALKVQLSKSEGSLADALDRLRAAESHASARETEIQALDARLKASEARAQDAEDRATAAEQLVAQELELASAFRQTVLDTFGSGSKLSAVLTGDQDR